MIFSGLSGEVQREALVNVNMYRDGVSEPSRSSYIY